MARKTLTDRLLRTLKTDAADAVVPGLRCASAPLARRPSSWSGASRAGRIRPGGRSAAIPAISLEQARDTARDWIALIQRGIDPAVQVAIEREANRVRQSNTFGAVAESFLEKHVASRRTATAIGRLVRGKLISRWRDRPIDTIGKRDVIDMIEDVQEKSGAAMARQSLTYARRLFGWAAARDLIAVNPCASVVTDDFLPPKVSRDRVLTDAELALVLKATAADGVRLSDRALHPLCAADGVPARRSRGRGMGRVRSRAGDMAAAGRASEECQRACAAVADDGPRSARGIAALCGQRFRLQRHRRPAADLRI